MAQLPVITLAKPKDKKDYVVLNRNNNDEQIEAYKKQGYTEEISLDDNKKRPGAVEASEKN
jgi:hypothetical protein